MEDIKEFNRNFTASTETINKYIRPFLADATEGPARSMLNLMNTAKEFKINFMKDAENFKGPEKELLVYYCNVVYKNMIDKVNKKIQNWLDSGKEDSDEGDLESEYGEDENVVDDEEGEEEDTEEELDEEIEYEGEDERSAFIKEIIINIHRNKDSTNFNDIWKTYSSTDVGKDKFKKIYDEVYNDIKSNFYISDKKLFNEYKKMVPSDDKTQSPKDHFKFLKDQGVGIPENIAKYIKTPNGGATNFFRYWYLMEKKGEKKAIYKHNWDIYLEAEGAKNLVKHIYKGPIRGGFDTKSRSYYNVLYNLLIFKDRYNLKNLL